MPLQPIGILSHPGRDQPAAGKDSPEKIRDSASQFEALLIGQILKAAHESQQQGLSGEEDQASASAMDFAYDYLARAMATRGGLGLAQMITKSLAQAAASTSSNPGTPDLAAPDTPNRSY